MAATFKQLTDFFISIGADQIEHTEKGYLAHAIGIHNDICTIHLCDWLEQVPRSKLGDYRAAAYRHLAERLGGVALVEYRRVFGEPGLSATPGGRS